MTLFDAQGKEIMFGVVITPEDLHTAFQMAQMHPKKDKVDIVEVRHPQLMKLLAKGKDMSPEDVRRFNSTATRLRFRNLGNKLLLISNIKVVSNY